MSGTSSKSCKQNAKILNTLLFYFGESFFFVFFVLIFFSIARRAARINLKAGNWFCSVAGYQSKYDLVVRACKLVRVRDQWGS